MFLPAFLDISPCVQRRYIWHFFGAVNMQKYCQGPVIAPEDYFVPPSSLITPDTESAWARNCFANQNLPRDEDLNRIRPCPIPQQLLNSLVAEFGSKSDAAVAVYGQRIPALEEWFCEVLNGLQANTEEEIEALVLVVDIPSFSCVCRSKDIPVLYYEFGAFREPSYYNVAYYSRDGVHLHLKLERLYREFLHQIEYLEPWELFTPKEILALYLVPEKLKLLQKYDMEPNYEAGILAEITAFAPVQSVSYKSTLDLLDIAIQRFGQDKILIRDHPGDPLRPSYGNLGVALDQSPSAVEFIQKCRRIISRTSNSIVEAQLWGKSVYTIDPDPYGFACLPSLDGDALQTIDSRFLSFIAFAFYFPMEFTYDIAYMRWRLTNPSWIEIYRKNLAYCLSVHGIKQETVQQPGAERLQRILDVRQMNLQNAQELLPQIETLKEKEKILQAQLDNPNKSDVFALQKTRERIRQIKAATSTDNSLPQLTILPEAAPETNFWAESTLFWDTGNGFSQQECSIGKLVCRQGKFEALFTIPSNVAEKVQALRWDPLEGRLVAITVHRTPEMQLVPMNASHSENGTDFFCTKDPMYRLLLNNGDQSFKISGTIRMLLQPEVEWSIGKVMEQREASKQQMEGLKAQLNITNDQLKTTRDKLNEIEVELEKAREPLYKKILRKVNH